MSLQPLVPVTDGAGTEPPPAASEVAAWALARPAAEAAASGSTATTPEGAKRLVSGLAGRPAAGSIDVPTSTASTRLATRPIATAGRRPGRRMLVPPE
jgi:hypothetical protein